MRKVLVVSVLSCKFAGETFRLSKVDDPMTLRKLLATDEDSNLDPDAGVTRL